MERAVTNVYEELKERANKIGLNIRVKKTKAMVQNRRTRRMSEILATKGSNIEVVTSFK
jgi:predicted amino acid-binding ACT domain protein